MSRGDPLDQANANGRKRAGTSRSRARCRADRAAERGDPGDAGWADDADDDLAGVADHADDDSAGVADHADDDSAGVANRGDDADHAEDEAPALPFDVRALRERMGLTQREFAGWFGFPVATLRHWERGNRRPVGTALVLLEVVRLNPGVVLHAVRKARKRDAWRLAQIEAQRSFRAPPGFGDRGPPWHPRGPRRR